jgi:Ca2+-binding EF-hand superfamily protein
MLKTPVNNLTTYRCSCRKFVGMLALAVLLSGEVAALRVAALRAADTSTNAASQPRASLDAQDIVFLGPNRPVWMRWKITVGVERVQVPFRQLWRDHHRRMFSELDTDKNGTLSSEEASKALPTRYTNDDLTATLPSEELSALAESGDGSISRDEFAGWYEQHAAAAISVRPGAGPGPISQGLFMLLDIDGDGFLENDELVDYDAWLRRVDFNGDETITRDELVDDRDARTRNEQTTVVADESARLRRVGPFILLYPGFDAGAAARVIVEHYDRDGDGELRVSLPETPPRDAATGKQFEINLGEKLHDRLDANDDGMIAGDELATLFAGTPDVELPVSVGSRSYATMMKRRRLSGRRRGGAEGISIRPTSRGDYELRMFDAVLSMERDNTDPLTQTSLPVAFEQFDVDNNDYIDRDEADESLLRLFPAIDRNDDDKLFRREWNRFARKLNEAAATRLTLTWEDRGRPLFDALDQDADGRLSIRELRDAVSVLLDDEDVNGDGRLAADEILRHHRIVLARGDGSALAAVANPQMSQQIVIDDELLEGPRWFKRMDRNRDGDLSRREFLGPLETFARFDQDEDGLISLEETEAGLLAEDLNTEDRDAEELDAEETAVATE